jgi:hypothetical protein
MYDIGTELFGMFIGLICSILVLSIPLVVIATRARRAHKAMQYVHAQRMAAIERGMELPPASLDFGLDSVRSRPRTALLPGLMWLFVGLAICCGWAVSDGDGPPMFIGLIPIGIGLAYLVYYFAEERPTLAIAATNV